MNVLRNQRKKIIHEHAYDIGIRVTTTPNAVHVFYLNLYFPTSKRMKQQNNNAETSAKRSAGRFSCRPRRAKSIDDNAEFYTRIVHSLL